MKIVTMILLLIPSLTYAIDGLEITWNQNPDNITGYYVFYGPTAATASQQIATTTNPLHLVDIRKDLNLPDGDNSACFTVQAFRDVGGDIGTSGYSLPTCTNFFLHPPISTPTAPVIKHVNLGG